jgi:hypothetical protein
LREPARVTIAADVAGAEIRYTLDGTEPTRYSPRYAAPFLLREPATVRARAFPEGATDLIGALARFTAPPAPLREDFESVPVGETTPGAETLEENDRFTARVSDQQASAGKHNLKFIDGPGQKGAFNPHVFYRVSFDEGRVVGRFDLFADAVTTFSYQWRDYDGGAYKRGPALQLSPGGKLSAVGKELLTIPADAWVRFEVTCILGDAADGTFDLKVFLPGEREPKAFARLACEPGFRKLDWMGFIANGQRECAFHVDEVELKEDTAGR